MIDYQDLLDFLYKQGMMISETFGNNCEVVISDLDQPDHAILYIFNGHVTGRQPGDPLTPQALERVNSSADGFFINYRDQKKGKEYKTSTLCYNFDGHNIAFCINFDYTSLIPVHNMVAQFLEISRDSQNSPDRLEIQMDNAIDDAITQSGKSPRLMSKEDRMKVIAALDKQGILKMQKSIITIARKLGISRYTVYNYLNELGSR